MLSDLRDLAAVGRALGDETRLSVLNILVERGETCVCEIMETLGTTQSNVSFHLTVLKNATLIIDKKIGKWMFYRINLETFERHFATLRGMFNKKRLATARPAASIFTLCCRENAVPLSRKHARRKLAEMKAGKTALTIRGEAERR